MADGVVLVPPSLSFRHNSLVFFSSFHGKSTIEVALQVGCYNHIPGDGREFVTVEESAVKVRATKTGGAWEPTLLSESRQPTGGTRLWETTSTVVHRSPGDSLPPPPAPLRLCLHSLVAGDDAVCWHDMIVSPILLLLRVHAAYDASLLSPCVCACMYSSTMYTSYMLIVCCVR